MTREELSERIADGERFLKRTEISFNERTVAESKLNRYRAQLRDMDAEHPGDLEVTIPTPEPIREPDERAKEYIETIRAMLFRKG